MIKASNTLMFFLFICFLASASFLQAGDGSSFPRVLVVCPECYSGVRDRVLQHNRIQQELERQNRALRADNDRLRADFKEGFFLGVLVCGFASFYFTSGSGN